MQIGMRVFVILTYPLSMLLLLLLWKHKFLMPLGVLLGMLCNLNYY